MQFSYYITSGTHNARVWWSDSVFEAERRLSLRGPRQSTPYGQGSWAPTEPQPPWLLLCTGKEWVEVWEEALREASAWGRQLGLAVLEQDWAEFCDRHYTGSSASLQSRVHPAGMRRLTRQNPPGLGVEPFQDLFTLSCTLHCREQETFLFSSGPLDGRPGDAVAVAQENSWLY